MTLEDLAEQQKTENLYYACLLSRITKNKHVTLPKPMITVQQLVTWLLERNPEGLDAFTDDIIQIMIDEQFVE